MTYDASQVGGPECSQPLPQDGSDGSLHGGRRGSSSSGKWLSLHLQYSNILPVDHTPSQRENLQRRQQFHLMGCSVKRKMGFPHRNKYTDDIKHERHTQEHLGFTCVRSVLSYQAIFQPAFWLLPGALSLTANFSCSTPIHPSKPISNSHHV